MSADRCRRRAPPSARVLARALILLLLAVAPLQAAPFRDDAGREVSLPEAPLRIVSLHDTGLTIPLLELGVVPVASVGRLGRGGVPFLRGALSLAGMDLAEGGIAFLGTGPVDVEAVAQARPDLILTTSAAATPVSQLQRVAPTVVIDDTARPLAETYALLARLVGREAAAARLERRYQAQLAELRRSYRPEGFVISVISATSDGKLSLEHTYGSLGAVLRDAGFRFPPVLDRVPPQQNVVVSPEMLQALDADIIIDTYRNDYRELPEAADRRMRRLHPEYCRFLRACREGRYIVLPRDEALALSYESRSLAIGMIIGILASQGPLVGR